MVHVRSLLIITRRKLYMNRCGYITSDFFFFSFRFRSQTRFTYFVERTALFPRAMLIFVQKRPIGLGIKNNLGSLY